MRSCNKAEGSAVNSNLCSTCRHGNGTQWRQTHALMAEIFITAFKRFIDPLHSVAYLCLSGPSRLCYVSHFFFLFSYNISFTGVRIKTKIFSVIWVKSVIFSWKYFQSEKRYLKKPSLFFVFPEISLKKWKYSKQL